MGRTARAASELRMRRLSYSRAILIAVGVCAILGLGGWVVAELLPRTGNVPIQHARNTFSV